MVDGIKEILRFANSLHWTWEQIASIVLLLLAGILVLWLIMMIIAAPFRARTARRRADELSEHLDARGNEFAQLLGTNREVCVEHARRIEALEARPSIAAEVENELGLRITGQLDRLPAAVQTRLDEAIEAVLGRVVERFVSNRSDWLREQLEGTIQRFIAARTTTLPATITQRLDEILQQAFVAEVAIALIRERLDGMDEDELEELDERIVEAAKELCGESGQLDADARTVIIEGIRKYIDDYSDSILQNGEDEVDPVIVEAAKQQIEAAREDPGHPLRQALVDAAARRLAQLDE